MPTIGTLTRLLAASALAATLGCTGQVTDNGEGPGGGSGNGNGSGNGGGHRPPGSVAPGVVPAGPDNPGFAVFHRLNRVEYNNTIRDLLGDTSSPADTLPSGQVSARSGYLPAGATASSHASRLLDATEALANTAMGKLASLLPCKAV